MGEGITEDVTVAFLPFPRCNISFGISPTLTVTFSSSFTSFSTSLCTSPFFSTFFSDPAIILSPSISVPVTVPTPLPLPTSTIPSPLLLCSGPLNVCSSFLCLPCTSLLFFFIPSSPSSSSFSLSKPLLITSSFSSFLLS